MQGAHRDTTGLILERQNDGPGMDDSETGAASQVRHAPEDVATAPRQVSANMMEARTPPRDLRLSWGNLRVVCEHRGTHLDVLEERRLAARQATPVEVLESSRLLR